MRGCCILRLSSQHIQICIQVFHDLLDRLCGESKTYLFHLTLHEKEKNYSDMLSFWISSFQGPVPLVLFTDGDIAMNAAICAMSYSNPCTVLTCVFTYLT